MPSGEISIVASFRQIVARSPFNSKLADSISLYCVDMRILQHNPKTLFYLLRPLDPILIEPIKPSKQIV